MRDALAVFAKTPTPGHVKSRLAADLDAVQAAEVYCCFIRDTHRAVASPDEYDLRFIIAPEGFDRKVWIDMTDPQFMDRQTGRDLGERMYNCFFSLRKSRYANIVLIGSDIPELDRRSIREAFRALQTHDYVIGPCHDGGYYLIGAQMPDRSVFEDINWSSEHVFQRTVEKIRRLNKKLYQLPALSDIDTRQDLFDLYRRLSERDKRSRAFPRATWGILRRLFEQV